jgi:hypothetical protein
MSNRVGHLPEKLGGAAINYDKCLTMCLSHADLRAEPVVLWACGRSFYDGRSAPAVRSDATRSSWLSKLHESREKPIERTSRARSGAGRWIAAVLP